MRLYTFLGYVSQAIGLFVFCRGFFPHRKASLSGYASATTEDVTGLFDRLIFVVVDALRSDFAFGPHSSMLNLQELIITGEVLPFTARASTPTVTLPRLKCLTTGAITGFLDAILNIAESDSSSTIAAQDSWVEQMSRAGRHIHMYGDDTWLRLFPETFTISEGTSSFFVRDFTEVDNNVTRHLQSELKSSEWDTLILHYLGLDHIGHLEGPSSSHMPAKQNEMDHIVTDLYRKSIELDAADGRSTLLIMVGDHGMTEDGNHGGASESETHTAVALMSNKFQKDFFPQNYLHHLHAGNLNFYSHILQSDIVPTLSMALGLPIPRNSLGIIPREALSSWDNDTDKSKALLQNARQLQTLLIAGEFFHESVETSWPCRNSENIDARSFCTLQNIDFNTFLTSAQSTHEQLLSECYRLMFMMQEKLLLASNNYNMQEIYVGMACLILSLGLLCYQYSLSYTGSQDALGVVMLILHAISAFASSFVEEEQVFWYYMATLALVYRSATSISRRSSIGYRNLIAIALPLISLRLLRRYNQTGQKHAGASDISGVLRSVPDADLSFILLASLGMLVHIFRSSGVSRISQINLTSVVACLICLKTSIITNPIILVRTIWGLLILSISLQRRRKLTPILRIVIALIFLLQARPRNYPVLALFYGIDAFMQRQKDIAWSIPVYFALQQASFFAMGNSNSLSGLDLSQAYNGVSEYNEGLVGVLLYLSTFLGPIFWMVSLIVWISKHEKPIEAKTLARTYVALGSAMYATCLCISCYILRHHLFVFSVFSPKLLFTAAWTLFHGLVILCI